MRSFFDYSDEVQQAITEKSPILALESTLITHGLPYPKNKETALAIEKTVRDNGVTPATIALMNGKIKIGLNESELDALVHDQHVKKASIRDIPFMLSQNLNAGTTVASTLFCAEAAGIKVFATGGIGGVHRGEDGDVSADLIALSHIPIAVICAGAKAILDIPKTLEFLETQSIPVIGYRTDNFPAFYTAETKYTLSTQIDDVNSLAKLLKTHWQLNMKSGVLIANPIPLTHEIPADIIEPVIANALVKAEQNQVRGKDITPFLLAEVAQVTKGKSLNSNIQLILNNVRLGALLAHKLHTL